MAAHITVVFGILFFAYCSASQCVWSPQQLPFKDPIFYQRSSKDRARLLVPASKKGLVFKYGQTVFVACPGSGNYLSSLGLEEVEITCIDGSNITMAGRNTTVADLQCKKTVSGNIKPTNEDCGAIGKTLSIGYNSSAGWMQLFEVCYDFESSIPLFSHHSVYGNLIAGAYVGNDRPKFSAAGLRKNIPINSAYKKNSQTKLFQNLLGSSNFITNTTFLSRGHLSPDADFIFHSWQRSTYFYANVVPQWMSINGGNWGSVENSIRSAAKVKSETLKVWTGATGVLTLNDTNGNEVAIYLSTNNNIPIPKYLWKIVCTLGKSCIAFVVHNSPYKSNAICDNICSESGWFKNGFENVMKGYVYCCAVNDLKNTLNNLPDILVKDVLFR